MNYLLLSSSCEIKYTSNSEYTRTEDTLRFKQWVKELNMEYLIPKYFYRDSVICLRRENNWYPHRNGELLTAELQLQMNDSLYYVLCGKKEGDDAFYVDTAYEIHLILLPKDKYSRETKESSVRSFCFYRSIEDTSSRDDVYYSEFTRSYDFYSRFFGDTLSRLPMNIVEMGDSQFMLCQSLQDVVIFGHYFYQIYTMIPHFSWIPHEVAHQWWGNRIFFDYRDYALGESLNEYIKLQFLKSRGVGYEEQMDYYETMMEHADKRLKIDDVHSIETMDESIAIYHTAPYSLEQMDSVDVCVALKGLYAKYKNYLVNRDMFERECGILIDWLTHD